MYNDLSGKEPPRQIGMDREIREIREIGMDSESLSEPNGQHASPGIARGVG